MVSSYFNCTSAHLTSLNNIEPLLCYEMRVKLVTLKAYFFIFWAS